MIAVTGVGATHVRDQSAGDPRRCLSITLLPGMPLYLDFDKIHLYLPINPKVMRALRNEIGCESGLRELTGAAATPAPLGRGGGRPGLVATCYSQVMSGS
jgi:hypothetical protein